MFFFLMFLQANIHSIMGCEDQVLELMVLLDQGVQEAVRVEERLEEYDLKLKVKSSFILSHPLINNISMLTLGAV